MKILFCSSEVAPFAKTGGLADVSGSLPQALGELGVEVMIVMPKYRGISVLKKKISENVRIHFVQNEAYFDREALYGTDREDYPDNLERFSLFCHEALALAKKNAFKPDVVHAHDWQAALIPVLLKTKLAQDEHFQNSKTLLTIHNMAYQGHFHSRYFADLGLDPALFSIDGFEFHGKINLLKGGILFSDAISTVSPTYAAEIQTREFGHGLEGVIQKRRNRLSGILNGIDYELWNPNSDKRLVKNYSAKNPAAKQLCKQDLQKRAGLEINPEIPLFSMVTRLAQQKGLDLLAEAAERFLAMNVQFVLLGDGDRHYQNLCRGLAERHPKRMKAFLGFDAEEAHRVYAGSDFFLMPSNFEPCGLGQMISLRYGAIPIVRSTGGLKDTITDLSKHPKEGNGFLFEKISASEFLEAITRAISFYGNKAKFMLVRKRIMNEDFSWEASAQEYKLFYKEIMSL